MMILGKSPSQPSPHWEDWTSAQRPVSLFLRLLEPDLYIKIMSISTTVDENDGKVLILSLPMVMPMWILRTSCFAVMTMVEPSTFTSSSSGLQRFDKSTLVQYFQNFQNSLVVLCVKGDLEFVVIVGNLKVFIIYIQSSLLRFQGHRLMSWKFRWILFASLSPLDVEVHQNPSSPEIVGTPLHCCRYLGAQPGHDR